MSQVTPGEWYIAVVCKNCKQRAILFSDLNEGKSNLGSSQFLIACPNCDKEGSYVVEHYQEPSYSIGGRGGMVMAKAQAS